MAARRLVIVGFVLVWTVAACGTDDRPAATTGPGTTAGGAPAGPTQVRTDKGVDDKEIRVAVLNDFSGPVATIGTPAAIGSEVLFKQVNKEGGVCGRQITAVREDTKYDNQVAVQKYRAVKDNIVGITQLLGTGATFALANDIARDNIATLAATGTSAVIPLKNIYIYITPFSIEAINGVDWISKNQAGPDGRVKLGVIYQADPYGEEGLAAVRFAAERLQNIDLVATASYAVADTDFTAQTQQMKDAGATVVWLHDTPRQTAGILGVAAQLGYQPLFVGGTSSYGSALVKPLGALLDNFRLVSPSPSWGEDVPEMPRFLAAMKEFAPDLAPDNFAVVGWIGGMVQVASLRKACENGDLTQAGLIKAMDGLKVDTNGMGPDLSYGPTPEERIPSREDRVNRIDLQTTFPTPITPYFVSDAAREYKLTA